jgi:hypothetical protein
LKLFTDALPTTRFALGDVESYDNGAVHLDYRPSTGD